MFKGTIFLTRSMKEIMRMPLTVKILDMDEESSLPDSPHIVKATCLLPPIEAQVAEVDGDEGKYNFLYANHLLAPYQQQYITAIIAVLYNDNSLIVYLPDENTYAAEKFCELMYTNYGIHIGLIEDENPINRQFYMDFHYVPFWLSLLYKGNIISPEDFLIHYPLDAKLDIDPVVLYKLLEDMSPYGESMAGQIEEIMRFHKNLHKNPNLHMGIHLYSELYGGE